MLYERDLIAKWNEYANYTTAREDGLQHGREEGAERKSFDVVKNLLLQTDFTAAKIAALASVTEDFVDKVKKTLN
jgi:hypothetical protein